MFASPLSLLPACLATGWAVASLNATMSLDCMIKLWRMPSSGSQLLRRRVELLRLNENAMSHKQRREADVVWLRKR